MVQALNAMSAWRYVALLSSVVLVAAFYAVHGLDVADIIRAITGH
ncbi:hypothetical protein [Acetobacter sacchari]|nr:hypothetical protein [Acetobacter sacchari]